METTVTKRGQTIIPANIRRRHHIQDGDRLTWIDEGRTIRAVVVPEIPLLPWKDQAAASDWWSACWSNAGRTNRPR